MERTIVIPGEVVAEGMDNLPGENTYRENDKIYAKVLGLKNISNRVVKITPLAGPYIPKAGDKIIGKIIDVTMSGWRVETGTAYTAMLMVRDATMRFVKKEEDLTKIYQIGDYIVVKIINVTSQRLIDLTMKGPGLHKVAGGRLVEINSQKVPRVIGKQGSMITLIKEKTGCQITVGQNGRVWIKGTPEGEFKAERAIALIAEKSHQDGLTEKVSTFLGGAA
jgi:exosome complex component RRP4